MRASPFVAAVVVLASGLSADAQDEKPPAQPAPRQDAAGVAALKRLGELVHSPGADGVREMSCLVESDDARGTIARIGLRWTRDSLDVDVRPWAGLPPSEELARLDGLLRFKAALPFLAVGLCDPAKALDRSEVAAQQREDGLEVGVTPATPMLGERLRCVLRIGKDGLPSVFGLGQLRFRAAFRPIGSRAALVGLTMLQAPRGTPGVTVAYFDEPSATPLPRRVEWTSPDGPVETFVLHDFVVDGKPVPGTSLPEARAGRRRRVEPAAQALFDRFDGATASFSAAGARSARFRVAFANPMVDGAFDASWGADGVELGAVRILARRVSEEEAADFVAGFRIGVTKGFSKLFQPPSAEWDAFDARLDAATGRVVLEPLDASGTEKRVTLQFDARGLIVRKDIELRAGGEIAAVVSYESRGARYVRVREVVAGAGKATSRYEFVPGVDPPVPTRFIIEADAGAMQGVQTTTYSDWVIDGRPLPGTETPKSPDDGTRR